MKKIILFFGICLLANFKTNAQATIYNDTPYPISVDFYDLSDCSYSLTQVTANNYPCNTTPIIAPNTSYSVPGGGFSCSPSTAPDYGFSVTIDYNSQLIQSDYMMNDGNQFFFNHCSPTVPPLPPTTAVFVGISFVSIWEVKSGSTDEIHVH